MSQLFIPGLIPALDANGDPISGATWTFYRSGTTTPVPVYSAGGTSLGSTIIADAAGRFPTAYLQSAYPYRAVREDGSRDLDPVTMEGGVTLALTDFGGVGDDSTDNDAAFAAWATALQTAGGGMAVIPVGTFRVSPALSAALVTFTGINGLTIICQGTIKDTNTYTGTQQATLFKFVGCSDIRVDLTVSSQVAVTTEATNLRGLGALLFEQGCTHLDIDLKIIGGLAGIQFNRAYNDPISYRCRDIQARVNATGCHYPYLAQFSGDNAGVKVDADTCGRNVYVYGVNQNNLDVRSRNQQISTILAAFNGVGCGDIDLRYFDIATNDGNPAAAAVQLYWGDSTPAEHRDIRIHLNVTNPSGGFGNTFELGKFSDGGGTPDGVGRGHELNGFYLTGYSNQNLGGNQHCTLASGAFAAPDIFSNIEVNGLKLRGASSSFSFPCNVVSDTPRVTGLISNGPVYFYAPAKRVRFSDCTASVFTGSTASTDMHLYEECTIGDPTNQAVQRHQRFKQTRVGGLLYDDQSVTGHGAVSDFTALFGNLTGTNNIFLVKLQAGTGALFVLEGYLVADQADTSGSRAETRVRKEFTATMNGLGIWEIQQTFLDLDSPRAKNTASVVTVSLVNGTAAGAYVAIACTNYSGSNARAGFRLTGISHFGGPLLIEAA